MSAAGDITKFWENSYPFYANLFTPASLPSLPPVPGGSIPVSVIEKIF